MPVGKEEEEEEEETAEQRKQRRRARKERKEAAARRRQELLESKKASWSLPGSAQERQGEGALDVDPGATPPPTGPQLSSSTRLAQEAQPHEDAEADRALLELGWAALPDTQSSR